MAEQRTDKKKHPLTEAARRLVWLFLGRHECIWEETANESGRVYVGNHARAYGPMVMLSRFPLAKTLRPWVIGEVCDKKTIPQYVKNDFWWRSGKWYSSLLDATVPYIIAAPLSALMRGVRAIPVYHDIRGAQTMKQSVETLRRGENILIFPQRPVSFGIYDKELWSGFAALSRIYAKRTGEELSFVPFYADEKHKRIFVGRSMRLGTDEALSDCAQKLECEIERLSDKAQVYHT